MKPRLILFDIDQTLIHSASSGRRALSRALQEILGITDALEGISMSGKTDTTIVFEVLEKNGMLQSLSPKKDLLLWERYVLHLKTELEKSKEARVGDGINRLLEVLQNTYGTFLGLLTGNVRRGAQTKLEHFGLWNYFPAGGFGDDHLDRNIVAQVALNRCRAQFSHPFDPTDVYVVGDSVRDIAAANAIRAKAVTVAIGLDPYESLLAEKPFALFHNFSDTAAVLRTLEGNHHLDTKHTSHAR